MYLQHIADAIGWLFCIDMQAMNGFFIMEGTIQEEHYGLHDIGI
jgi:hypothetical protein